MADPLYLFCVAKAEALLKAGSVATDDRNPLLLHRAGDEMAILSTEFARQFCGPRAEQRLEDPHWVAERAVRHEQVVERVMRVSPVLPARLGTLFSSRALLDQFLGRHRKAIAGFLDRVAGKQEWGVRALLDRAAARKRLLARIAGGEQRDSSSPGTSYMERRRALGSVEENLRQRLAEVCDAVAGELVRCAADFRQRPLAPLSPAGETREEVLNLAFLVALDHLGKFRARVERASSDHAAEGVVFKLSGPWPPYSFCPSLGTARR